MSYMGTLCYVSNDDSGLYDITEINVLVQFSSGHMPAMKNSNPHIKIIQVGGSEQILVPWPVKYCAKAGVDLILLTCKLVKGSKISNKDKNNMVVQTTSGNIILDP